MDSPDPARRARPGLRARFLASAAVVAATTVALGAWSAGRFFRLSNAVGSSLRHTEEAASRIAAVTGALEREDDALLLSLTNDPRAAHELGRARAGVAAASGRLASVSVGPGEPALARQLSHAVGAYHAAADALIATPRGADAYERYHAEVNPLLRRAVASAAQIRDGHFRETRRAAEVARDDARRAAGIASGAALVALALSVLVAYYLGRLVVWPLRELSRSVDALRRGDFANRVAVTSHDELGRLAEDFNAMAADLAEFRRSNLREVLRAKQALEAALAALPDAVLVIAPGGRITSANPAAARVLAAFGAAPDALARDLPLPDRAQAALSLAVTGVVHPESVSDLRETLALQIAGRARRLLPRALPIDAAPGGEPGAVLVLYDVTELARLDEMRVELVAVASHELSTPITTLRMTLLLLQETEASLTPRQRDLLATARLGIDQLSLTVEEFLDLTRIESGQLRLMRARLDPRALLEQAARDVAGRCDELGIALTVAPAAGVPPFHADAARVRAVLANVLSNAIKYTPAGGSIRLQADAAAAPGGGRAMVEFRVTDSGPGVPEELRERIFEKFFRVEHHRGTEDAGTRGVGIGLYLCRQIVEAHGGVIAAAPGPDGSGTQIVLRFPVAPGLEAPPET